MASLAAGTAALGTLWGVYVPCVQNMLGGIPFLRLPWMGAQGGILVGMAIILLSISTTIPTAMSMTAIATNGRIPSGGPYYVVTRSLGASLGGAISFLFYLGTLLAGTMDALGMAEAFQDGFDLNDLFSSDRAVIAIITVTLSSVLVYVGIRWINYFANIIFSTLILSLVLSLGGLVAFAGGAEFGGTDDVQRARSVPWLPEYTLDEETGVTPSFRILLSIIYPSFVGIMAGSNRSAMLANPAKSIPRGTLGAILTITGLYSTITILTNVIVDRETIFKNKLVLASVGWPTELIVTIAIVVVSYGSSMQAMVSAPQLLVAMLSDDILPFQSTWQWLKQRFSCCRLSQSEEEEIKADDDDDEEEEEAEESGHVMQRREGVRRARLRQGRLPLSSEVFDGAVTPTDDDRTHSVDVEARPAGFRRRSESVASGASSPGSARRHVSKDGDVEGDRADTATTGEVLVTAGWKEIGITWLLASIPCFAGNLDRITPILTMFFLMMYATVNVSCLFLTIFAASGFRPRRPTHWLVSLGGVVMCLVVMFLVSWWQALIGIAVAVGLYFWIESGEQRQLWSDWGAGLHSMQLGRVHKSLVGMRHLVLTPRNWRPQIMVLLSTDSDGRPLRPELVDIVSQLQNPHNLTVAVTLKQENAENLTGDVAHMRLMRSLRAQEAGLEAMLAEAGLRGFVHAVLTERLVDGFLAACQVLGLGPLRPNTVLTGWPRRWRDRPEKAQRFVGFLKMAVGLEKSLMVYKCDPDVSFAPTDVHYEHGTIDVWWMMRDSGLLLLIPTLLRQHSVWRHCRVRLFVVDSSVDGRKEEVELYLRTIGIEAEVHLVQVAEEVLRTATASAPPLSLEDRAALAESMGASLTDNAIQNSMTYAAHPSWRLRGEESPRPSLTSIFPTATTENNEVLKDTEGGAHNTDGDASVADANLMPEVASPTLGPTPNSENDVPVRSRDSETDESSPRASGRMPVSMVTPQSTFFESATAMNEYLRHHSSGAALVVANLMLTPSIGWREFMDDIDTFTHGIKRALLLRGTGKEIVTIYA